MRGPSPPVKKVELMCPEEEEEEERGKEEEMENNWRQKRRSIRKKKEGDAFKRDSLPLFFFFCLYLGKKGCSKRGESGGGDGMGEEKDWSDLSSFIMRNSNRQAAFMGKWDAFYSLLLFLMSGIKGESTRRILQHGMGE